MNQDEIDAYWKRVHDSIAANREYDAKKKAAEDARRELRRQQAQQPPPES